MNAYVKAVSKRSEIEGKEKTLPIAHLGGTMISHGEEFDPDSEYGQCLIRTFFIQHIVSYISLIDDSVGKNSRTPCPCSRVIHHG